MAVSTPFRGIKLPCANVAGDYVSVAQQFVGEGKLRIQGVRASTPRSGVKTINTIITREQAAELGRRLLQWAQSAPCDPKPWEDL